MSALDMLAWSALPEKAIVARVSNEIARKGWEWERGRIGDIKEMIAETLPPRGMKAARIKAVRAELEHQTRILYKRRRNKPYKFVRPHKNSRISFVSEARQTGLSTCSDINHVDGRTIFYGATTWSIMRVVIFGPKPAIGPRQEIRIRAERGSNIANALHNTYGALYVKDALAHSRRVILDFVRLETRIEERNGEYRRITWDRV